jgi:hypothetical protein
VVEGRTKRVTQKQEAGKQMLEYLLQNSPERFQGLVSTFSDIKTRIEQGREEEVADILKTYVATTAETITERVNEPEFSIRVYRVAIGLTKVVGAVYGGVVRLAADELVDYLEKKVEDEKRNIGKPRSRKKELGGEKFETIDSYLLRGQVEA